MQILLVVPLVFTLLHTSSAFHARKKLVYERQFAPAPSFARAIPLTYLELHVQSKICLSELQSFLLQGMSNVLFRVKQDKAEF